MSARNTASMIGAVGVAALGVAAGLAIARSKKMAVKAHMALSGDWEKQLKSEHRTVKKLLKAMVDSEIGESVKRAALLETVAEALTRHAVEEENVIYPSLRSAGAKGVDELVAEHAQMKTLIRRLNELPAEDPAWLDGARTLKALVYRHVRKEENDMFPLLHSEGEPENKKLTKLMRHEGIQVGT